MGKLEVHDCDKCLWATRTGSCSSWSCEFISKNEAYEAWKKLNAESEKENAK